MHEKRAGAEEAYLPQSDTDPGQRWVERACWGNPTSCLATCFCDFLKSYEEKNVNRHTVTLTLI